MSAVVPPRFLFRWAFQAPFVANLGSDPSRFELPAQTRLPSLSGFDGAEDRVQWELAWNAGGLACVVTVTGKKEPPVSDPLSPLTGDNVQLWLDTRCTQNVHRATRFCHHFVAVPVGRGKDRLQPSLTSVPLAQARESSRADADAIGVARELRSDGYRLALWFPADSLTGFDPENHQKLGFYGLVRDHEWGEQPLLVGREFPFEFDPSLWQTVELVR